MVTDRTVTPMSAGQSIRKGVAWLAIGNSGSQVLHFLFGIVLASVLFGALFQGCAEVSFEINGFSRDMVVMLQGFIVLFSGAMAYVLAPWLARALALGKVRGVAHG